MNDETMRFSKTSGEDIDVAMKPIYEALKEKGYSPVAQICGFLQTADPCYITQHKGARKAISKIDFWSLFERAIQVYVTSKLEDNEGGNKGE